MLIGFSPGRSASVQIQEIILTYSRSDACSPKKLLNTIYSTPQMPMLLRRDPDDLSEVVAVNLNQQKQYTGQEEKLRAPDMRHLIHIGSEFITIEGSAAARSMAERQALAAGQRIDASYVLVSTSALCLGSDGTRGPLSTFIASYYKGPFYKESGL